MATPELPASLSPRAPATILVIEDDPAILELLCVTFSSAGFIPLPAASGGAGLARLEHERADLVVLDLGLPDLDGWEVASRIRDRTPVTPAILVLTGTERVNAAATSLQLGADDYLIKPFTLDELLTRAEVLLRHTRSAPQ